MHSWVHKPYYCTDIEENQKENNDTSICVHSRAHKPNYCADKRGMIILMLVGFRSFVNGFALGTAGLHSR